MRSSTLQAGLVGLAAMTIATVLAAGAAAQSEEDLEHARALFAEGVTLTEHEQWADAAERFRQVLQVRATAQVKYNLALALEHTGELVEASALLREAAEDADLDRRTRRHAREILATIEPRIAHLTVRMEGDEAGAELALDGEPLGLDQVGQPLPVDPGAHRVALRRAAREVASREVTLGEGESSEVVLVDTAVRQEVDDEPIVPLRHEPEPVPASASVLEEWWFWTILGAIVVVGVGVGVGVALATGSPDPVQGNLSPGILQVTLP